MKRYLPHLGILLGVAIAVYALFFSESDEDKIRALLERLEDAIAVGSGDSNIVVRAARVKGEFSEILSKDVRWDLPELSGTKGGRKELIGLAAKAPQLWRTAAVDLDGLAISIDESGERSVAVGDAQLDATRHDGRLEQDSRKVSISLEKIEGDWRIVMLSVSSKDEGL